MIDDEDEYAEALESWFIANRHPHRIADMLVEEWAPYFAQGVAPEAAGARIVSTVVLPPQLPPTGQTAPVPKSTQAFAAVAWTVLGIVAGCAVVAVVVCLWRLWAP